MKIQLLNKIAQVGTDLFDKDWEVSADVKNPDAIMVRSTAMHDMEFGDNLKAIARAGAGVNNIPLDRCAEKGIVVFNTPGANANGVKELTLAALLLASRKIVDGVNWSRTLDGAENGVAKSVEKGVIIAAAGMAAHLAGAIAANTVLPVIGIPCSSKNFDGIDALLSTVQMPTGIPVATVAVDGAGNAALLGAQILALSDESLKEKLRAMRAQGAQRVLRDDKEINEKFAKMQETQRS